MRNSLLQLRCEFLRLLKTCPACLKAEPQYPPASSRLNGNRPWPRSVVEHLEEAISLLDGHHFLVCSFPDRAASSEHFEAQQRLVTPIPFDVVTRGEKETRFDFRHSSRSPLIQQLTHEPQRVDLVIVLARRKGEQLCFQVR